MMCASAVRAQKIQPTCPGGKIRTYYIAAVETEWNYAPANMDLMTGKPFEGETKIWTEHGKDRIGNVYRKAIYREYTDEAFNTEKKRPKEWEHLGIMGPLIRAEVGDTIVIHFRNNATQPYSMHPHGVSYSRDSEGTPYADTSMAGAGLVPPNQTHTYIWNVPERAGPGESDGSSVVWLYHPHNWVPKDVNAGLIGPMVITRRGMARPDGSPKDVDREFATLFMLIDEVPFQIESGCESGICTVHDIDEQLRRGSRHGRTGNQLQLPCCGLVLTVAAVDYRGQKTVYRLILATTLLIASTRAMLIVGHEAPCRISALACRIESRQHTGKKGVSRQVSGTSDASKTQLGLIGS
jgi:hypothetical protein